MAEMSAARAALRDRCVASLRRLSQAVHEDDEEWLSLDLTMGQLKAMMALGLKGSLAIGDLGRRIGISSRRPACSSTSSRPKGSRAANVTRPIDGAPS